jgi:hypothetical protein
MLDHVDNLLGFTRPTYGPVIHRGADPGAYSARRANGSAGKLRSSEYATASRRRTSQTTRWCQHSHRPDRPDSRLSFGKARTPGPGTHQPRRSAPVGTGPYPDQVGRELAIPPCRWERDGSQTKRPGEVLLNSRPNCATASETIHEALLYHISSFEGPVPCRRQSKKGLGHDDG